MNVFLGWSGRRSKALAGALEKWLPRLVGGCNAVLVDEELGPNSGLITRSLTQFEQCSHGIAIVTPESARSTWLHFLVGAAVAKLDPRHVYVLLLGLQKEALLGTPLSELTAVVADRGGVRQLVDELSRQALPRDSYQGVLREFRDHWAELSRQVDEAYNLGPHPATNASALIEAFRKHGLPEKFYREVYFEEGFESHALYATALDLCRHRMLVFGRKNRKLFDKEHRERIRSLLDGRRGVDFRCLFLDPGAQARVLLAAHRDVAEFPLQLSESIGNAVNVLKSCGAKVASHARLYSGHRASGMVVVDDAVLFSPIHFGPDGYALPMTRAGFTLVGANEPHGKRLIDEFESYWHSSKEV